MKKRFYVAILAITLVVMGAGLLGSSVNASAATKWQFGTPKSVRGDYQTKVVKKHVHQLSIAKNFVSNDYRLYNLPQERTGKLTLLLMWRVPSRKISTNLYQIKSVTRSGKHVRYYIHTYSHQRIKFSKTKSFNHKPYYYKVKL